MTSLSLVRRITKEFGYTEFYTYRKNKSIIVPCMLHMRNLVETKRKIVSSFPLQKTTKLPFFCCSKCELLSACAAIYRTWMLETPNVYAGRGSTAELIT